jgi:hypothetical protein
MNFPGTSPPRSTRSLARGIWCAATLGLVALVAVANVVTTVQKNPPPARESPSGPADPVMRQERRFAALRAEIRSRGLGGLIGYRGDLPAAQAAADAAEVEAYYRAQFALAPAVLDPEAERHEWIVVNLTRPAPGWQAPAGWRLEEDFGDGVRLLRKAAP